MELYFLLRYDSSVCCDFFFQPSDGISKVLSGGQVSEEEAQSLLKRSDLNLFSVS